MFIISCEWDSWLLSHIVFTLFLSAIFSIIFFFTSFLFPQLLISFFFHLDFLFPHVAYFQLYTFQFVKTNNKGSFSISLSTLGIWPYLYICIDQSKVWVMWSISHWPPLLSRTYHSTQFRLGHSGSMVNFSNPPGSEKKPMTSGSAEKNVFSICIKNFFFAFVFLDDYCFLPKAP